MLKVYNKTAITFLLLLCLFISPAKLSASSCLYDLAEGLNFEQQSKTQDAVKKYQEAIGKDRKCIAAYLRLAEIYTKQQEWKKAEKALYKASKLDRQNSQLKFALAKCYIMTNKFAWSLRTLKSIDHKSKSFNVNLWNYLMGRVSLEMGDSASAIDYLNAVDKNYRETKPEWNYYLALAYAQSGETVEYRRYISAYLKNDERNHEFNSNAQTMLDKSYEFENDTPLVAVSLSVSAKYNSNVTQDPDDPSSGNQKDPSSMGLGIDASLAVNPLRMARHSLGLNAFYNSTIYFSDPADDFSIFSGTVLPEYSFRFHSSGFDQQFSLAYQGNVSILQGGDRAEEKDFYVYSESHGAIARWAMNEEGFGSTSIRFSFGKNMFRNMVRDNWGQTLNIGQSFFLLDQKLKIYLQALGRYENALKDAYDRWGIGGFTGLTAVLPWQLNISAWLKYEYLDHYNSASETIWNEHRKDNLLKTNLAMSRYVFKDYIEMGISYSLTKNISSVADFDYIRHLVSFKITGRYEW